MTFFTNSKLWSGEETCSAPALFRGERAALTPTPETSPAPGNLESTQTTNPGWNRSARPWEVPQSSSFASQRLNLEEHSPHSAPSLCLRNTFMPRFVFFFGATQPHAATSLGPWFHPTAGPAIRIPGISEIMPNPFSPAEHKPLSSKIILGCLSMFIIINLILRMIDIDESGWHCKTNKMI